MQISEIFFSIQGESVYSGLPCVFVRTAGCNLSCTYCDTEYARVIDIDKPIGDLHYIIKTPQAILDEINRFPHTNLVQITGGEPLLQDDIYELFYLLHENDFQILLETNGSLDLAKIPSYVCKIVDIKSPASGYPDSFLLSNFDYIDPTKDNLKFVLADDSDYLWMKEILFKYQLFGSHILVSTVFSKTNPKTIAEKIIADGLDVRFQLQIHKYIDIQ